MDRAEQPGVRVFAIAANYSPTLIIHLLRPLRGQDAFAVQVVTEEMLVKLAAIPGKGPAEVADLILEKARPDLVFSSRYNGPLAEELVLACRARGIPFIIHLDDNLLEVPPDQGAAKAAHYQQPKRLQALRTQMEQASLAYFSTEALRDRMQELGVRIGNAYVGPICAAVDPLPPCGPRPAGAPLRFGYAASAGHMADLHLAAPGIVAALRHFPAAEFELIGSIDTMPEFSEFGARVRHERRFVSYDDYLLDLSRRGWDLAIAPLCDTPFTRMKTYTKWVEYAAAGLPVIASDHPIYRDCCADGAAVLVADADWAAALPALLGNVGERATIADVAQRRVMEQYSLARLRDQLLDAFAQAGVKPVWNSVYTDDADRSEAISST